MLNPSRRVAQTTAVRRSKYAGNLLKTGGFLPNICYFYSVVRNNDRLHFSRSGLRVRAAGGNANNGTNAGAFYTNTNNTATNANANYSSPLYFAVRNKPEMATRGMNLATRQKITTQKGYQ